MSPYFTSFLPSRAQLPMRKGIDRDLGGWNCQGARSYFLQDKRVLFEQLASLRTLDFSKLHREIVLSGFAVTHAKNLLSLEKSIETMGPLELEKGIVLTRVACLKLYTET